MPIDTHLASKIWYRYAWCRDHGHADFVQKADKCERFVAGDQWEPLDRATLQHVRRPALTINKILSTIANVMGEQIYNRAEIAFRPRSGAPQETADILTKVFKYISDNNQLDWKRSDAFADGIITSRGYLDVRTSLNDSAQAEVVIENINPKNVIPDPDADHLDPDTWSEVFVTKWMTADDIAVLYSREDAELLRNRGQSFFPYGYDSIEVVRDRFGGRMNFAYGGDYDNSNVQRNIRVIERQYRELDRQLHFVYPTTGDMRPVPAGWSRNRIAAVREQFGLEVVPKVVRRIKWTVIADNVVLHDDWSPYKHFTIVPFFPYLRHGRTIGLVENLLGPQELLNKVTSQELHVVNTTANSGWKVKTGALINMSVEELEQRGAQTGLVVEVNELDAIEKIQPNSTPTGLDRISYKAEEHIKGISGVSDSMQGFDREDVAAKAIQAKRQAGSTNLAKPLDSLTRTDFILARNVLDLVQEFYTEERILTITHDRVTGETEDVVVNQVTPEGAVVNDLTVGEYSVVVSSVPQRETLEDSQFEQAVALRELGVMIPDEVLIESSRLINKKDIVTKMRAASESPEARAQAELAMRGQQAEVAKTEAEAQAKAADAGLKQAKAAKETVAAQKEAATPIEAGGGADPANMIRVQGDLTLQRERLDHEIQMDLLEADRKEREMQMNMKLKAKAEAEKRMNERVAAAQQAAAVQNRPQPQPQQGA